MINRNSVDFIEKRIKRCSIGVFKSQDSQILSLENNDDEQEKLVMARKREEDRRKFIDPPSQPLMRIPLSPIQNCYSSQDSSIHEKKNMSNEFTNEIAREKARSICINLSSRSVGRERHILNDIHKPLQKKRLQTKESSIQQEKQMLSQTELSELYSQCINLATANKINQENTWNLPLIDYIGDVLESDKNGINFQRASCTIDASVMIYSYRVDSVHKNTFKVLGGLSRNDVNGENPCDSDEEGKKKKKKKRSTTLETNLNQINLKEVDMNFETDAIFKKMSSTFDQGGASGLLFNHLGVYQGCKIAFDSDIIPDCDEDVQTKDHKSNEADKNDEENKPNKVDLKNLVQLKNIERETDVMKGLNLSRLTTMIIDKKKSINTGNEWAICPEVDALYSIQQESEKEIKRATNVNNENKDDQFIEDPLSGLENEFSDINIEDANVFPASQLDDAIQQEERLFQEMQTQSSQPFEPPSDDEFLTPDNTPGNHEFPVALASCCGKGATTSLNNFDSNNTFDENGDEVKHDENNSEIPLILSLDADLNSIDTDMIKNWAGPTHWKYKERKSRDIDNISRKNNKNKKIFYFDFTNDSISEDTFAKPKRGNNTLTKATLMQSKESKYLLPDDIHFKVQSFKQLFTKPTAHLRFRTGSCPINLSLEDEVDSTNVAMNNDISSLEIIDESEDKFAGFSDESDCDDASNLGSCIEDLSLGPTDLSEDFLAHMVEEPQKVAKIGIGYAKFAKKIDVRQLKKKIWEQVKIPEDCQNHDIPESNNDAGKDIQKQFESIKAQKSFQNAIESLESTMDPAALPSVSVPYCFICLLHLANERTLELIPPLDPFSCTKDNSKLLPGLGDFSIFHHSEDT